MGLKKPNEKAVEAIVDMNIDVEEAKVIKMGREEDQEGGSTYFEGRRESKRI